MTENQVRRQAYLHILCGDHGSQKASESLGILPIDWHVDLIDVAVDNLSIAGCCLI